MGKKEKLREALATGLMGVECTPQEITTENIKKSKCYDHFKNGLHLNITQIKSLLNAPSLHEAKKIEAKMPIKIPRYAAWQVRMNWGFKDKRVERCFVCDKPIIFFEDEDTGISLHLDTQSVYFRTSGNWPSSILDMEKETIEILICDDCIKERKDRMFVIKEQPSPPSKHRHIRKSLDDIKNAPVA